MNSIVIWAFVTAALFSRWTGFVFFGGVLLTLTVCKALHLVHVAALTRSQVHLVWSCLFAVALLFLCMNTLAYDATELATVGYFSTLFLSFLFFLAFLSFSSSRKTDLERLFATILLICTGTIIGEFVLVNLFDVSNALMPASKNSPSYLNTFYGIYRPFGLTGQFSITGCLVAISLLLVAELRPPTKMEITLSIAAVLLTLSAQAFLALAIVFLAPSILNRIIIITPMLSVLIAGLGILAFLLNVDTTFLSDGLFKKFEFNYITKHLFENARIGESFKDSNFYQLVFGHFKHNEVGTEVGLINFIYNFGILPTAFYLFTVVLLVWPSRNWAIWLGLLLVSNLHYAAFYFIETQLLFALMILVPRFKRAKTLAHSDVQTDHMVAAKS